MWEHQRGACQVLSGLRYAHTRNGPAGLAEGHRIPDGFLIPLSVVPSKSLGCFYTGTCWISRNHIRRTMELGENDMTDTLARLEGARSPHASEYGQSPAFCETD